MFLSIWQMLLSESMLWTDFAFFDFEYSFMVMFLFSESQNKLLVVTHFLDLKKSDKFNLLSLLIRLFSSSINQFYQLFNVVTHVLSHFCDKRGKTFPISQDIVMEELINQVDVNQAFFH